MSGNTDINAKNTNVNPASVTYSCRWCERAGRSPVYSLPGKAEDGSHLQDNFRRVRGHSVPCQRKALIRLGGSVPDDLAVTPAKSCGYCGQAFGDAHVAGAHSVTCSKGPAFAVKAPAKSAPKKGKKGQK